MRLLNTQTIQLESFNGNEDDIPPYAILSHTWGNDEITFQDVTQQPLEELRRREAFYKVQECCAQARKNGYDYVWVDTCCIDKTSSAELSEAINSMFKWYQQASICYAFLVDFDTTLSHGFTEDSTGRFVRLESSDTSFFSSRWFTRGWTLQELIAPRHVSFFDKWWINFGSRDVNLLDRICQRTGIWPQLFDEPRCLCFKTYPCPPVRDGVCRHCLSPDTLPQTLESFTISVKMSWASSRVTSRKEDSAYCLLGLFSLNIPMLYGEGDKAFLRLQEAIVRQAKDQSILLWRDELYQASIGRIPGCLAPSSSVFKEPVHIVGRRVFKRMNRIFDIDFMSSITPIELTDTAIQMDLWICPCTVSVYNPTTMEWFDQKLSLGILDLSYDDDYLVRPALLLEHLGAINLYRRLYHNFVVPVDPRQIYDSLELTTNHASSGASLLPRFVDTLLHPSVLKVRRYLNQAVQKNVGILRHPSPDNAVSLGPLFNVGPKTGPVYLLAKTIMMRYTSRRKRMFDYAVRSGGSHPPLSNYDAHATEIPSPWVFEKCQHSGVDRHLGGIHFVSFYINKKGNSHTNNEGSCGQVAIIWGMHREVTADGAGYTPWKPWCRVFNMPAFLTYARTSNSDLKPSQLYHGSHALHPSEIQNRLEDQRRQLCLANYEQLYIPQESENKALFPDSCEDDWTEDRMNDIANDPVMDTHLTIRLAVTEGLGRRLYEVQFDIDQVKRTVEPFGDQ
ncbi:heterokaryon incompatibility protein-domain-containing protein [Fusarium flagelliforme]|uniref:heterokaryon incompatibility protein-domain-containing protein n=1 Tax=Fusarium flagelliforme TaxID=2675880 RepID=UPI001E8EBCE5|nr:heterokaryon incompatibility protein-domain-containing protein [Fusarium flagelliforme]KAH7198471.1 heterokaryon incompatibility protein-domain-containing protein [Fusarium flagelliforme]